MRNTHEAFIAKVAALAIGRLPVNDPRLPALKAAKLVYGAGNSGLRGITYYDRWKPNANLSAPFVEVCAFGQESWLQVAGTTIHELAHVLAGYQAGHGPEWKAACGELGLNCAKAAGTRYQLANLAVDIRCTIAALPKPDDGEPVAPLSALGLPVTLKPCAAGIGTRGGKSRGKGSGSRLRLWACDCGCKARVASDVFEAIHTPCGTAFKRA